MRNEGLKVSRSLFSDYDFILVKEMGKYPERFPNRVNESDITSRVWEYRTSHTSPHPRPRSYSRRPVGRTCLEEHPGVTTDPQRTLGTSGSPEHNVILENRNGRYLPNSQCVESPPSHTGEERGQEQAVGPS